MTVLEVNKERVYKEFFDLLHSMDWNYEYSDDHSVYMQYARQMQAIKYHMQHNDNEEKALHKLFTIARSGAMIRSKEVTNQHLFATYLKEYTKGD